MAPADGHLFNCIFSLLWKPHGFKHSGVWGGAQMVVELKRQDCIDEGLRGRRYDRPRHDETACLLTQDGRARCEAPSP